MSNLSFKDLPPELLINIFKHLRIPDLRNLMLSSKYLQEFVVNETSLWKLICRDRLLVKGNVNIQSFITWYDKCRISHNWCKGRFNTKVIVQHNIKFMPWMQLLSPNVVVLSFGSDLKCFSVDHASYNRGLLWNLRVPTVKRFDVRTNDISRFIIKDHLIVCGNRDGSTAVFEFHDVNRKPTLLYFIKNCHNYGQVEVTAVERWKSCIITGSSASSYLHLWQMTSDHRDERGSYYETDPIENGALKKLEVPECDGCWSLSVDSRETKLAIGLNGNRRPVCIDLNTTQCIMVPQQGTRSSRHVIRDIHWHNETGLVYVTHSGKMQYVDIRTGNVTYETWDPFESSLYCLKSDGDRAVVTGSAEYSRCVLFDLRTVHPVQMYFTQKRSSPVYSLDFDAKKLIAAADQRVVVANFNVNASTTTAKDYSHVFKFIAT